MQVTTGDDERAGRIAANEAVFRLVNEKIEALNAAFATTNPRSSRTGRYVRAMSLRTS